MSSNFWSRSRSLKGLNHLVDDAFLRIDENNKKEGLLKTSEQEKEKQQDLSITSSNDEDKEDEEKNDAADEKDSIDEDDEEDEKKNKSKVKEIAPYYDSYFFEDDYLKDTEYADIIKTAAISGNQYRPNVDMLEKLLKMEDLTRILVLQLVGDHEDFLSLEDYFSNPLVLCKLLDYILDPRYCIEEDEEDEEENSKQEDKQHEEEEEEEKEGEKIEKGEIDTEKDTELTKLDSASSKKSMDLIEFYRCAVSAVDVLVIDINAIAESFLKHDFLIKKLWSMLDKYPCLANDASTAFLKINERLLQFAEMSSISEGNSMVSQWMDSMDNEEEEEDTFMDVFMSYPKKTENKSNSSEEEQEEEDNDKKDSSSNKNNIEKNNNANKKIGEREETPETELMSKMSTLERYLYFIVMKENMVDKFIKHLEISSFMDFLLKIISTDKPKQPTYVILLLKQQRLIEKLLDCLDSSNVSTVQNTATDFLKALITLSANSNNEIASAIGPNELTRRLVSPGMISKIGLLMAQGGLPLSNCVGIIIEIIRKNHSDYDLVQVMQTTVESHPPDIRDPIYLGDMIQYFARNLPELCAMMKKSLPKNFKTPFGIIEPLGMDRFKVCELVAELLHCSNMALLNEPEGQLIVKERDPIRRVKVAELLKEHFLMESNDFDEDDEGQFDMRDTITIPENIDSNKTNGTSDKKVNNSDSNNQLPNNDNNDNEEDEEEEEDSLSLQVESLNIKSEENSSDDVLESVKPKMNNSEKIEQIISDIERNEASNPPVETDEETGNKPSTTNTTGEVFGDLDYLQTEEEIRKNPVIGDRLKLALKDNNVVDAVLEMLFDFPWNNFLHNVVFDIVQQILNGSLQDGINRFLIADLFLESRITELIIAGDQYCQQYEETNKLRLGYMGHLTLIAEEVAKFVSYLEEMNIHMLIPDIEEMLSEKAWVDYSNAVLNEARDRYNSTFGEEEAGMMGDCWGSNAFDNDGVIDFSSENELKHTSEGDDEVNDSEPVYPDVSFRNSVDEMMIGRHSDDIHIDLEAEDEDDEEDEDDDDDEERIDLGDNDSEEDGDNLNKKSSKTKRLEEEEEDDVNEDSTIEYVNLNGEVVVTTVKEFLKMNSVASMNNPSSENDFKEIKNISNSKSEPNQVYIDDEEEDEDDFDYINNSTLSKNLHHNGTMLGNDNGEEEEEDDDDYIDPNDDGHSYAKINSLIYGNNNKLVAALTDENSSDSDEINSSNSDMSGSDVDDEEDEDDEERRGGGDYNNNGDKDNNSNNKKNNNITNDDYYPRSKKNSSSQKTKEEEEIDEGRALCRQKTKDNMKWDEGEQQRIFGYKMLHDESL